MYERRKIMLSPCRCPTKEIFVVLRHGTGQCSFSVALLPVLDPYSDYFVDGHNYIWNYASPELMVRQTVWTLGRYSKEGHERR